MIKNGPKIQFLALCMCIGLCILFLAVRSLENDLPEKRNAPVTYDLNAVTENELDDIPGVGSSLAKAIVAYRESYGKFVDKDELLNIRGMTDELYSEIKQYITLGGS